MPTLEHFHQKDPRLRPLALLMAAGILVLFAGLWWVQIVLAPEYRSQQETQSTRTIRFPAVRGKILDRDGRVLADTKPVYDIDLNLEDLSPHFRAAYAKALEKRVAARQQQLGRKLTATEKRKLSPSLKLRSAIQEQTRYEVCSNIVVGLSARMQIPVQLNSNSFQRQFDQARAVSFPIVSDLTVEQVARFEEQRLFQTPGLDLNARFLRQYPNHVLAAHVLGYLIRNNESSRGELADYNYRLEDYAGNSGIEALFDKQLHGTAGSKSVTVNNLGYRQTDSILDQAEAGQNLVLTIDAELQRAAESALQEAKPDVRGSVVVMDVQSGDILAMASAPAFDPNYFLEHPDPATWKAALARWQDQDLKVQLNRAMQENYPPGSIFKIVVGLAALEQGVLNPDATYHSEGFYRVPGRRDPMKDTAGAGDFDFNRAFAKSSNPYFIEQGLKPGVLPKIISLGQRLHLGEKTGLIPRQEARGYFPSQKEISKGWVAGNTANLSIGQGRIAVTPLQMAVMTAAVANGGKVLQPRLVSRIEPVDSTHKPTLFPAARVRDNLGVSEHSLKILHRAMLADVESPEGSGRPAAIPGYHIAGKTGTAQVERQGVIDKTAQDTWFVSFAPFESPRYAVVAMVEGGDSGKTSCAPIAHKVYQAILQQEQQLAKSRALKLSTLAEIK